MTPAQADTLCAGVMFLGRTADQELAEFQKMLDINVMGAINGMHTVLNAMKQREHGTIINVASVEGRWAFAKNAGYCASKFTCVGLTEAVRKEVAAHNVRVMVIEPGIGDTQIFHLVDDHIKESFDMVVDKMGGSLAPEQLTRTVRFMYELPQEVILCEVVIAPTRQQD